MRFITTTNGIPIKKAAGIGAFEKRPKPATARLFNAAWINAFGVTPSL